jgi:putative ATPase
MPKKEFIPLAERIRPRSLSDFIGQQHLVGPGAPLRQLLERGTLPSIIFWGPPGVGKTTLANIFAATLNRPFQKLSAVESGVKEVRAVLDYARSAPGTVLFIDEIHRFSKSQQDSLLGAVEQGLVTLIGATTENPSFEVIGALLSRCQVYVLKELEKAELEQLLHRAVQILKQEDAVEVTLQETDALYRLSGGDGRKALNLLDLLLMHAPRNGKALVVTNELVQNIAQQKIALYDKAGEAHYDTISAFIKSIRGSDPNAGLYYLARMLDGGEDILFIARRLIILASEDVGNANPNALLLATSTFQACERIGLPEARIVLAQCVTYLATSPKSNAAYMGIGAAMQAVQQNPALPIPLHIRNAPTKLMKNLGYGKNYKYSHSYINNDEDGAEGNQEFLPDAISGSVFYQPKNIGKEKEIAEFIRRRWGDKYTPNDAKQ